MDWDVFFNPAYINLDEPNYPVIDTAKSLYESGYNIVIFSGRSKGTKDATVEKLKRYEVPYSVLKMRPTSKDWMYMPDDQLKKHWLDDLFPEGSAPRDGLHMVFDDRNKVVDMWRKENIPCFQVAPGDF